MGFRGRSPKIRGRGEVDVKALAKTFLDDTPSLAMMLPVLREVERRRAHPLFHFKPDEHPERNQAGFHASQAVVRVIIGGNQSGKSYCAGYEAACILTERHPHQKIRPQPVIFAISATYQTLDEGIWRHLQEFVPEWLIHKRGPQIPNYRLPAWLELKTGGRIRFFSAEANEEARRVIQAAAIDYAFIDEEVDQSIWKELMARRLARGGKIVVTATLVRSEPWMLDLEDRAEAGDPSVELFRFSTYRARDCGHVDARVVKEMEEALPDEERDVRLRGHSLRRHGLVYPRFSREHIVKPFEIPPDWTRYMAIDPGFRVCAALWVAVAPDGKFVIYREGYWRGLDWTEIGNNILSAEGWGRDPATGFWKELPDTEHIACRYIDPSSFATMEGGQMKLGGLLQQAPYRIYCCPAQNDVDAGIERVRLTLQRDLDGIPQLRVFSDCIEFQREIRRYRLTVDSGESRRDEARARPIKRDDHLMDCLKYLCLSGIHPRQPGRDNPELDRDDSPPGVRAAGSLEDAFADEWKDLRRRALAGSGVNPQHPGGLGSEY